VLIHNSCYHALLTCNLQLCILRSNSRLASHRRHAVQILHPFFFVHSGCQRLCKTANKKGENHNWSHLYKNHCRWSGFTSISQQWTENSQYVLLINFHVPHSVQLISNERCITGLSVNNVVSHFLWYTIKNISLSAKKVNASHLRTTGCHGSTVPHNFTYSLT